MKKDLEKGFALRGWRVQPRAGRFTRGLLKKTVRRVEPRAMRVLVDLAKNQGEFRSKDEIFKSVWGDRAVGDDCLIGAIHALRQALGDDPRNPAYIETRNNVGYRLIAPIRYRSTAGTASVAASATAAAIAVIGVVVAVFWQPDMSNEKTVAAVATQRIAVLPFMNVSGLAEDDYYATAMLESLISDLAKHPEVRVISRTSSMNFVDFKGSAKDIASELGADLLVEGSVHTQNGYTSVRARLIDPDLDAHVWAEQVDKPVQSFFEVQREIGDAIAAQIGVPSGRSRISLPTGLSDHEFRQFIEARYFLAKQTPTDVKRALDEFTKLANSKPLFANAHLGRAQAMLFLFKRGQLSIDALSDAERAAVRFENLHGMTAESHGCIGQIRLLRDWDFETAHERYRSALLLNPSDVVVRRRYAWLLVATGDYDQARSQIDQIRILDPLYYHDPGLAVLLLYAGDVKAAISEFERVDSIARLNNIHLRTLLTAYLADDREMEARTTLLRMLRNDGYELGAELAQSDELHLSHLIRRILTNKHYKSSIVSAGYYALLGQSDEALADLEKAVVHRDPFAPYLGAMPEFSQLRDHDRFQSILRDIGISPESRHVLLGRNTTAAENSYATEADADTQANRSQ